MYPSTRGQFRLEVGFDDRPENEKLRSWSGDGLPFGLAGPCLLPAAGLTWGQQRLRLRSLFGANLIIDTFKHELSVGIAGIACCLITRCMR